jgi:TPR repeat protein
MGWFYLNGVGVEKDREKSWYWYRKSARHGEPRAMFSLGYLCWFEGDYVEANTWFSRAINAGHVRSQYWLAKLLWKGLAVQLISNTLTFEANNPWVSRGCPPICLGVSMAVVSVAAFVGQPRSWYTEARNSWLIKKTPSCRASYGSARPIELPR